MLAAFSRCVPGRRARIAPHLGGRITACELVGPYGGAQPVLQAYSETHGDLDNWAKGGLYPLILVPYSGRLRDAKVLHQGREWLLQPHQGSRHTLHGIAQRRPWDLVELDPDRASLLYRHRPYAHWRWAFEALMAVSLEPSSLSEHHPVQFLTDHHAGRNSVSVAW